MVGIEEQDQGHHDLDLDQDQSDRKYDKSWQTWVLFRQILFIYNLKFDCCE